MQISSFSPQTAPKGVFVVFHGLNLDPAQMHEICQTLAKASYEVHLVALSGHKGDGIGINEVDVGLWMEESRKALEDALESAEQRCLPCFCFGYSMGAAFGCLAAVSLGLMRLKGFVFLSPAFETQVFLTPWIMLKRLPRVLQTSLNIGAYRYNARLGLMPYFAVSKAIQKLRPHLPELLKRPALVAYDLEDEVVNPRFVASLTVRTTTWRFHEIKDRTANCPIHHLVVNSEVLGEDTFQELMHAITQFAEEET